MPPQSHTPNTQVSISANGIQAIYEHHLSLAHQHQQDAEHKRQEEENRSYAAKENRKNRHHDYFIAAFEVFLGFLFGIIAEAELDIAALVVDFFKKLTSFFH